mmetsp:Transcript_26732/g.90162  ORF Transcript_26732/g.90162 Transcript_26732/m.90162 type:complete len:293 (-) Transcript_26732:589-1467(-)
MPRERSARYSARLRRAARLSCVAFAHCGFVRDRHSAGAAPRGRGHFHAIFARSLARLLRDAARSALSDGDLHGGDEVAHLDQARRPLDACTLEEARVRLPGALGCPRRVGGHHIDIHQPLVHLHAQSVDAEDEIRGDNHGPRLRRAHDLLQDVDTVGVAPVVQDELQVEGIASGQVRREGLEKAASDGLEARTEPGGRDGLGRALRHRRQVEDEALNVWPMLRHLNEHVAHAAADVADGGIRCGRRPVGEETARLLVREALHRAVELCHRLLAPWLGVPLPKLLAESLLEAA